jgi:hypothetical protein
MSDDTITTGTTVNSPSSYAPEPQPSHAKAIDDAFQENLNLIAKTTDDGEDYIRERKVQEKHRNGQDISLPEQREWHDRHDAALKRARDAALRAQGVEPSQQPAPAEVPVYVAKDAPDYDQHYEAAKQRFDAYYNDPERIGGSLSADDHRQQVLGWLQTYDPSDVLSGHFMASPLGPQMAETIALEGGPELIKQIVNMPTRERAAAFQKLEGYLYAREQQRQQEQSYQRAANPPPRTFTQAPPIMKPVRGGANPPSDLHSLAQREDGTAYIRARRAQEKRANEDR